jgi:predicted GNAT superfamily acetyltransferase
MTPVFRRRKREEIKISIGPFRNSSDYNNCLEIQREVWRFEDIDIVPIATLMIIDQYGGILLGAYSSIGEMIGFVCSLLGVMNGEMVQHSHMLGVRTAYRNFNVGYKLKLAQRREALKRKTRTIAWTFDPMQPLNAYFNLGKLGARAGIYKENFYGETSSVLHRGLPTDRLLARWELDSKHVAARLDEGPPRHDLRKELRKIPCINTLSETTPGVTVCSALKLSCTAPEFLFEIPYNLPDIKIRYLGVALEWQGRIRQVFRAYFKKGYTATDFWTAEDEGHQRTFYLLQKKK